MEVWCARLASIAGSGCPSLGQWGVGGRGSSDGSGDRRYPLSWLPGNSTLDDGSVRRRGRG